MMKRIRGGSVIVAMLMVVSVLLTFSSPVIAAEQKKNLTVGGAGMGGTAYLSAASLSDYVTKNSAKIALTAQTTRGFVENCRLVNTGEMDLGLAGTANIYPAIRGEEKFKEGKHLNLRGIINAGSSQHTWVTLKGKRIKSIKDLAGKRVNIGAPGSNTAYIGEITLKIYGIYDKIHKSSLNFSDAAAALRDGKIDAYCVASDPPVPCIIESFSSKDAMLISLEDDMIAKIIKEYPPFSKTIIAANTYEGQKEPATCLGYGTFLMINKDVPDWVSYELLKTIVSPPAIEKLIVACHKWSELKDQDVPKLEAMAAIGLPLHGGAEKFWKEKGLKIPAVISTLK